MFTIDKKTYLPFNMVVETQKERYRYDTFYTKEPETLEWIRSFNDGDLFFDIGANIGVYSLYFAHLYPNGLAVAFEPSFINFVALRHNIGLNQFRNVMCLWAAISGHTAIMPFFEPLYERGGSGGQLNAPVNENGVQFDVAGASDIITYGYSDFINTFHGKPHNFDRPTHIKIDVDGQENLILGGLPSESWNLDNIKSILVEFNNQDARDKFTLEFEEKGFTIDNKFNQLVDHSRVRRKQEGINAENIIFTRK